MDSVTREAFLRYALTPVGIGAIAGFITSVIIPKIYDKFAVGTWDEVDGKVKGNVMLILNFAVPLFATFCLGMASGDDLWLALVVGFAVSFPDYATNQGTHVVAKAVGLKKSWSESKKAA